MTDFRIVAAATDSDDSIYVLLNGVDFSNNRALRARVCVFDPLLQLKHEFAVGSNLEAVTVKTQIIMCFLYLAVSTLAVLRLARH